MENDRLMMLVIVGTSTGAHFFRSEVGMGSSSQNLSGDARRAFVTSSCETGLNPRKLAGGDGGDG